MALDHYVSQVHLKNFYSPALGARMHAIRKVDLKRYTCDSASQCRIEEGNTNPYLAEPRIIEDFLKGVEPVYNASIDKLRSGILDSDAIFAIAGFAAYVDSCSPASMRIGSGPLRNTVETTAAVLDSQGLLPAPPPELGGGSLTDLLKTGAVQIKIDPSYPQSIGATTILRRLSLWGNSRWDIVINDIGSPFFTSDYPIGIEVGSDPRILNRLIPLAPDEAIRILPDIDQRQNDPDFTFRNLRVRKLVARKEDVRWINAVIVAAAETTVYFRDDLPWVPGFVKKHSRFRVEPVTERIPTGSGFMLLNTMRIQLPPSRREEIA